MKLITHNILMCNKKGCTQNNYHLKIVANQVEMYKDDQMMAYSKALMQRLVQKLDLAALQKVLVEDLQWKDVKPLFLEQEMIDAQNIDIN